MPKMFGVGKDAQKEVLSAMALIAEAVGSTMGPGGRPFGFDKTGQDMRKMPSFTKDGLTVLKSLQFDNPVWDAVLHYCRQAASHSVIASGDGTTSTIILANAVAQAIAQSKSKIPQVLARQIEREANAAIEAIRKESITGEEVARLVALTSSNGDEELTDVVMESIGRSSAFGAILVDKNPAALDRYKIYKQDGYSNCRGYAYNQVFATSANEDAASSKPIKWSNPSVLIFNGDLILKSQIDPILTEWYKMWEAGKTDKLIVVCYEASDEVTNTMLVHNRKMAAQGVGMFIVKPRLTAEFSSGMQILRDIASFCGIDDNKIVDGGNYKSINDSFFGSCKEISISLERTAFLGRADNHWVEKRVEQNASIIREARSPFDKEIAHIRNSELAEGMVKVEVGGGILPEIQERADRFDDASKAAQACLRSGALPGGGVSYARAAELAGVSFGLKTALESIFNKVTENYGVGVTLPKGQGEGYRLNDESVDKGSAVDLRVLDATETVCAVIKNGVTLGVQLAILGGYSLRPAQEQDYE